MVSIRKIAVLGRTYRHLNRYRQIITILIKYGFGDLIERLKFEQYIKTGLQIISSKKKESVEKDNRAERIRLILEELGPTFIKLGQILSTRPDIIPIDIMSELVKLQDNVPPFESKYAREIIEEELGKNIEDIFHSFDEKPIASASIGQVHRAVLEDEVVAVKIQRPSVQKIIEIDLEIMLHLATLIEKNIEEAKLHKPINVVEEFARSIKNEMDYAIEAANMERVASNFLKEPKVYVPKVYNEFSGTRVLTMEFIDGIKVSEVSKLIDAGLDRKEITTNGADFILKQVFEYGFFHADPHPGNIFILENNVLCPVDYGMTGTIDVRTRDLLVDILESVANKNSQKTASLLLELGEYEDEPNLVLFDNEINNFMGRHLFKPVKDIDVGQLLQDIIEIATKHGVRVPPGIFFMMKAFASVEGIAKILNPDFDMIAHAQPYVKRAKLERYSPKKIAGDFFTILADSINVFQDLPKELLQTVKLAKQNKLLINVKITGLESFLKTHDQVSNRLSFAIIIASLIMGSALLLAFNTPPLLYGISVVGILGFSVAAVLGICLLIAILKKGMM
ncbi:MAG: AarF/ABC1/UbiB kinase family protein [Desulfobacterales bacterium]|nr:AarF/ABC1/UbiB kinase family protein [Desulfobacterales bacterium]